MDVTTFRYLISLVAQEDVNLHLMDVVTNYLYGSLDNHICMKLLEGFNLSSKVNSKEDYSIKLNKFLYGLKQSGHMWYNRLSKYLLKEGYKNDLICPYIYMKRSKNEFSIIVFYVGYININGTPNELTKAIDCLKK